MQLRIIPCALLSVGMPAIAQQQAKEAPASAADKQAITKVEIKGSAEDYDPRRDDTASKTVLSAEEIRKYGDDNIFDVLKRAPGVTVADRSIRMRGLGNGYTQILVNGDRPPPGFSMDALTPDQIERIEVIRAASAEYSMQAIAGTINIVLRKVVAKPQRDLRLNAARSTLTRSGTAGGTWGEKVGNLSYFVNGSLFAGHNEFHSTGADQLTLPDGTVGQARVSNYNGGGAYRGGVVFPRLNWKIDERNELNLSAGLQASSHAWSGRSRNTNLVGSFGDPDWIDMPGRTSGDQWMMRGRFDFLSLTIDQYDGQLVNSMIAFDWRFAKNWGAGLGYRYVSYNLKSTTENFHGEVKYDFKGPTIFLEAGF